MRMSLPEQNNINDAVESKESWKLLRIRPTKTVKLDEVPRIGPKRVNLGPPMVPAPEI